MKLSLVFALLALFITPLRAADPAPPAGFRALFNGQDLSGWHGLNPHEVGKLEGEKREENLKKQREEFPQHWRVEDGELVNAGTGPYATTDEEFGDIELLVDYKTVPHADSGIYLRGTPQVQIWDITQPSLPEKPDRNPKLGSGGLFNNTPKAPGRDPLVVADKPFGQWNTFRIKQVGAHTWVWLNEKLVVDGATMENYWDRTKPLAEKGPIMLQTHGGEIRWRNLYVRPISADEGKRMVAAIPPLPTIADVPYGPHPKQVLHFWKAASDKPTPLLFFIHGGGWQAGNRMSGLGGMLANLLKEGISVVSVEYRFINEATQDGVQPPVLGPLGDAARALQFVRSKAAEWNIDKVHIAASGGSAGACTSLWLAFHDDLADPKSADPIARESTRLFCAAVDGAQTTLDPQQMQEWTPNSSYGGHAFGVGPFANFLASREKILPWIAEYSPYALVTSDDPPIFMHYGAPPAMGQDQKDPTHTSNFGVKLQEKLRSVGVECELAYPGAPDAKHQSSQEYLIARLKGEKAAANFVAGISEIAAVTKAMQAAVDQHEVAGAVTVVAGPDQILHQSAVGLADVAANKPMTADAMFWIASMTKPITGCAIMMLQDAGKLSIDDPVGKYLPELAHLQTADGQPGNLTIRHLLTHTSGLAEAPDDKMVAAKTLADLVPAYVQPLKFVPGSKWQYCQSGINSLGRIIEVVSGQSLPDFYEQRIFRTIGMKETTFYPDDAQLARTAKPYKTVDGKLELDAYRAAYDPTRGRDRFPAANGGLFSTAGDYTRFCQMLLRKGLAGNRRVLSEAAVAQLSSVLSGDVVTGFTPGNGWGAACCVVRQPQGVSEALSPGSFGHGGAYGTQAWIDPVKQRIYVLMVQRTNFPNSDASDIRKAFQAAAK